MCGYLTRGVAAGLQRAQDAHHRGRCVQAHAIGQAGVVAGVVGQHQGQALIGRRLAAQDAPAAGQFGHEGNPVGLWLVAHHVHLGPLAAPGHALEADGPGADAAVHLGEHHLHRQVARLQAVRIGLPLLARTAGGDELQHWRVAREQRRVYAVRAVVAHGTDCKAGGVEHDIDRMLGRQGLHGGQ